MKIYMEDDVCAVYKLVFHRMKKFFVSNDQVVVNNPKDADLVVIGTCASCDPAEERSNIIASKVKKFNKPVYVFGCMAKVNPAKLKIKNLFSSREAQQLVESIIPKPKISWDSISWPTKFRTKKDYRIYNPKKHFVAISTGCAFNCSYCHHKIGAGNIVSRPMKEILSQIKRLIKNGAKTIILTGIDTACYGIDNKESLPLLLENILKIPNKTANFHIGQFNPRGLYFDFKSLIKSCQDKRIKDFQLPIQTANKRLLKIMNRNYSIEDVRKFIIEVKEKNKGIIFRTDVMVGFPTETEEEFNKSIDFAVKYFDEVAVYGFELKHNTPIASYGLPFFDKEFIEKRRLAAIKKIKEKGVLFHSGGQDISSLYSNDKLKEKMIGTKE